MQSKLPSIRHINTCPQKSGDWLEMSYGGRPETSRVRRLLIDLPPAVVPARTIRSNQLNRAPMQRNTTRTQRSNQRDRLRNPGRSASATARAGAVQSDG